MERITLAKLHRLSGLIFVLCVTLGLLALVFVQAGRGAPGVPAAVVYAFTAAFGLEYLGAAWTGRFGGDRRRQLQT